MSPRRKRACYAQPKPHHPPIPCLPIPPKDTLLKAVETYGIRFRDEDHEKRFLDLSSRDMGSTVFADLDTLNCLGVYEDIRRLYTKQGWGKFLELNAKTYPGLTLEFLSSLRHGPLKDEMNESEKTSDSRSSEEYISFQLFGESLELSYTEIDEMFGWSYRGHYRPHDNLKIVPGFNSATFWNKITGSPKYVANRGKTSDIKNPCLSIAHRIFKCSLLGCGRDFSKLPMKELFLLWALVEGKKLVNTSFWLVNTLFTAQKKGPIYCGGLITLLATLPRESKPPLFESIPEGTKMLGEVVLDITALTRMKMIEIHSGKFIWKVRNCAHMVLPAPESTSLDDINNWLPNQSLPSDFEDDNDGSDANGGSGPDTTSELHNRDAGVYRSLRTSQDILAAPPSDPDMNYMIRLMFAWHVAKGHLLPHRYVHLISFFVLHYLPDKSFKLTNNVSFYPLLQFLTSHINVVVVSNANEGSVPDTTGQEDDRNADKHITIPRYILSTDLSAANKEYVTQIMSSWHVAEDQGQQVHTVDEVREVRDNLLRELRHQGTLETDAKGEGAEN